MDEKKVISQSQETGATGEAVLEAWIRMELRCLFHPIRQRDDFGIDGLLEIVSSGPGGQRHPTGRLLGLQLKTSAASFESASETHWRFRCRPKDVVYWRDYSVPVLLVLLSLEKKRIWWVEVDEESLAEAGTGWTVLVPKDAVLDTAALPQLEEVARRSTSQIGARHEPSFFELIKSRDRIIASESEGGWSFSLFTRAGGAEVVVGSQETRLEWRYGIRAELVDGPPESLVWLVAVDSAGGVLVLEREEAWDHYLDDLSTNVRDWRLPSARRTPPAEFGGGFGLLAPLLLRGLPIATMPTSGPWTSLSSGWDDSPWGDSDGSAAEVPESVPLEELPSGFLSAALDAYEELRGRVAYLAPAASPCFAGKQTVIGYSAGVDVIGWDVWTVGLTIAVGDEPAELLVSFTSMEDEPFDRDADSLRGVLVLGILVDEERLLAPARDDDIGEPWRSRAVGVALRTPNANAGDRGWGFSGRW